MIEFIAGIILASTEGRERITLAEAAETLEEWMNLEIDLPENITAAILCNTWNQLI